MRRDAYEVLGVARDADDSEIKSSFRRLARELHPDVNRHDPAAEEKFKEAAEAYEILSDAERRQIYDRYGQEGLTSSGYASSFQGFGSFADIFDAFFGGGGSAFGGGGFGGGFAGRRGGPVQGGDVAVSVEVSLAEAASGTSKEVQYDAVERCGHCRGNGAEPGTPIQTCPRCEGQGQLRAMSRTAFGQLVRTQVCDVCRGEGRIPETPCAECSGRGLRAERRTLSVDIPAGIADDQRIRLTGRGHSGEQGGPPGDLYVLVRLAPDERFMRDGNDLVTVIDLPAPAAALGARVAVPTLEGEREIEIAPGTQPGEMITLPGMGMPSLRRGRRGDQRVVVNVVVPRRLSKRQRELAQELNDSLREENLRDPDDEGLFAKVRRAFR